MSAAFSFFSLILGRLLSGVAVSSVFSGFLFQRRATATCSVQMPSLTTHTDLGVENVGSPMEIPCHGFPYSVEGKSAQCSGKRPSHPPHSFRLTFSQPLPDLTGLPPPPRSETSPLIRKTHSRNPWLKRWDLLIIFISEADSSFGYQLGPDCLPPTEIAARKFSIVNKISLNGSLIGMYIPYIGT